MAALAIMAAAVLAHAPVAEYAPMTPGVTVCGDPQLTIILRRAEGVGAGDQMVQAAFRQERCGIVLSGRVFVDYVEMVPWRVDATGAHGVEKMIRGRMPAGNGTDAYFYGLAADFKFVGR